MRSQWHVHDTCAVYTSLWLSLPKRSLFSSLSPSPSLSFFIFPHLSSLHLSLCTLLTMCTPLRVSSFASYSLFIWCFILPFPLHSLSLSRSFLHDDQFSSTRSSAAYRLILRLSHSSPLCHNRCEIDLWLLFHPSKQLLSDASCHNRSMLPFLPVSALLLSTHSIVDGISSHIYNMISEQNRVLLPSLSLGCSLLHLLSISGFCGFKQACIINASFTNSSERSSEGRERKRERLREKAEEIEKKGVWMVRVCRHVL